MRTAIAALEGNKVRLTVEVDEVEFDRSIDQAFKRLAKEINLPGFRQGKAPRKVIEAHIGTGIARSRAIQDSLPEYLAEAVREHNVDLIATPDIAVTSGEESGPVVFDATCEVRPEIDIAGHKGLRVEMPALSVDDAEIDEVIATERRRHGTLVDVDRPAATGDVLTIDLTGTRDGTPVPGLNTADWVYELGKGWVSPGFDGHLAGATAGSRIEYSEAPNGTEDVADLVAVVKKVQQMDLADLTDEWVDGHVADCATVAEWRGSVRARLEEYKLNQARSVLVDNVSASVAALVAIDLPEAMVEGDFRSRVRSLVERFAAQGMSLEHWLSATGQPPEGFLEAVRTESRKAVRVDLALRAVARQEGIEADDDDVEAEIARIAMRVNQKADKVRRLYDQNDAIEDLRAQIRKSKALDWLIEHAALAAPDGSPIDASLLLAEDTGKDEA